MTSQEYSIKSKQLQQLSKKIPLQWGRIQNNVTDAKVNMFSANTIEKLEILIAELSEVDKNYFRRRWFLWQCANVDEYLFYSQENVMSNSNSKDQNWDIQFHNNPSLRFDLKGTIVPKSLREGFTLAQEKQLIHFYYNNQSKGIRSNYQNRLFIVHHSFKKTERSMYLRCHWELKKKAFQEFTNYVTTNTHFIEYKKVKAKCIFILESETNEFTFAFN